MLFRPCHTDRSPTSTHWEIVSSQGGLENHCFVNDDQTGEPQRIWWTVLFEWNLKWNYTRIRPNLSRNSFEISLYGPFQKPLGRLHTVGTLGRSLDLKRNRRIMTYGRMIIKTRIRQTRDSYKSNSKSPSATAKSKVVWHRSVRARVGKMEDKKDEKSETSCLICFRKPFSTWENMRNTFSTNWIDLKSMNIVFFEKTLQETGGL